MVIMYRTLCVVMAGLLVVGSFGVGASTDGLSCASELELEPWQEPRPLTDERFSQLFPDLDLVVTDDRVRLPEIPRIWAATPDGHCSLLELGELIPHHRDALHTQQEFEAAAWLAALTADTEVMGVSQLHEVVSFERSADDAARVVLHALSPATGTKVEWLIDVHADGHTEATWTVLELVPEIRSQMRGWFIGPGDTGPFETVPGTANEQEAFYPTHDGKSIRVVYFLDRYDSIEDAEEDADRNGIGGVLAYDLMNDVWGFPSTEPRQHMDITVSGCACIFGGDQVRIFMPPNALEWVNQFGFTYTDADELAYLIIAHEFFHHFQWSLMQWNQPGWVMEGTARFIETIIWPSQAHQPGSIQYAGGSNGFPWVMENPDFRPQQHSYSYGLVWGHIYDHNGGVEFFKRLFEESAADPAFPGFVDRALESMGGEHESFGDALAGIGERMVSKSFAWPTWDGSESYDWGIYLPDVKTESLSVNTAIVGQWDTSVQDYAMKLLEIPSVGAGVGATAIITDVASFRTVAITQDEEGTAGEEFTGAYLGAPDPYDARHLFVVSEPENASGGANTSPFSATVLSV